ncbi:MAG: Neu5Ac permease [Pseudomonadota bacterium]|jgi:tripartite ATP-independent transporter DctM subunit
MNAFWGLTPFVWCVLFILVLSLSGLPIGLSMLGASVVYLMVSGQDVGLAAEQIVQGLTNSYTLLAIPLFILASELMNLGSLSDRLLAWCNALVGRFRGGMGHVNVVSSLIFSGMSGSAIADVVGVGKLTMDMMTKNGRYTPAYAAAITAATAVIGPIIPPSIPLVLYALISDTSIGYLFAAGVVPGLIMTLVMMALNAYLAHRRNFPVEPAVPMREFVPLTIKALPALMMPVVLLGGIYSGVMTPTEAAAVAALYTLVISVVLYRSVTPRGMHTALLNSGRQLASVGMLIAGAMVFNYVVAKEDLPKDVQAWLAGYQLSKEGFLLLVNVLLLVLGCLLEGGTVLLVVVPILIPAAQAVGLDMVHFGLVVTINLMIGLITPPYGLLLFVTANLARTPLTSIIRETMPFIGVLVAALAFITYVPDSVLWLPRLLGYKG